jgi:hypothetical protein
LVIAEDAEEDTTVFHGWSVQERSGMVAPNSVPEPVLPSVTVTSSLTAL